MTRRSLPVRRSRSAYALAANVRIPLCSRQLCSTPICITWRCAASATSRTDYIPARMAFRVNLIPQALWASEQSNRAVVESDTSVAMRGGEAGDPFPSQRGTPFVDLDLKHIEDAVSLAPQKYPSLSRGKLDEILVKKQTVGETIA